MAVKFIESWGDGLLGFWEITETTDLLISMLGLGHDELQNLLQYRNELRKKEWLSARLLLREMTDRTSKIDYDASGKPLLKNWPGNISITHSSNCVAIYYHPYKQPGIDVELITRDVGKAARKFLSPKELADCTIDGATSNKDLMLRWCAKEAVFKMVHYADVDFASQIACYAKPLNADEGELGATFIAADATLTISLHFRMINEMLLVWGII